MLLRWRESEHGLRTHATRRRARGAIRRRHLARPRATPLRSLARCASGAARCGARVAGAADAAYLGGRAGGAARPCVARHRAAAVAAGGGTALVAAPLAMARRVGLCD